VTWANVGARRGLERGGVGVRRGRSEVGSESGGVGVRRGRSEAGSDVRRGRSGAGTESERWPASESTINCGVAWGGVNMGAFLRRVIEKI
jgi:hypothetical protein